MSPEKKAEYDRRLRHKLQTAPQSRRPGALRSKVWVGSVVAGALLATILGLWILGNTAGRVVRLPPDDTNKLAKDSPDRAPPASKIPTERPPTRPQGSPEQKTPAPPEPTEPVEPARESPFDRLGVSVPASEAAARVEMDDARREPTPSPDAEDIGGNPAVADEAPCPESADKGGGPG